MKLSKYLGVSEITFKVNGIFDVTNVPYDERYFIDVFTMKGSNIVEFENSYTEFLEYFSSITDVLQVSKNKGDAHWKEAYEHLLFKEFQGIFFGFSKTIGKGNGIGTVFANQMTKAAHTIVKNGITDPEVFLFAPFLEDDIGFDRISDMVVSILFNNFARYTERMCKDLNITKNLKLVKGRDGQEFLLPWYVNKQKKIKFPIFLCPQRFSRRIPGNFDWEDPFDFYMDNGFYKNKIDELIKKQFNKEQVSKKDIKKTDLKDVLLENKSVFKKIVEEISSTDSVKVTLKKGAEEFARLSVYQSPKKDVNNIPDLVKFICEKFKHQVENKGYWRSFYQNGYHLNEEHIQAYFYFLAESFCEAFKSDIFPEHHTGIGRVDFRVGVTGIKPVLVEVKLSFHGQLFHGYEVQLPKYLKAENAEKGVYLVVKLLEDNEFFIKKTDKERLAVLAKNQEKINRRIEMLASRQFQGSIPCEQFVVDALPKASASKPS